MGEVEPFFYQGELAASKSLLNRALIAKAFFPQLVIRGNSEAQDVLALEECLQDWRRGSTDFDCHDGGTTFRFLLAFLSRHPGQYVIKGSERLLSRPHGDLQSILLSLGCEVQPISSRQWSLKTQGWKIAQPLDVSLETSSQFASALILSSWNLEKALHLRWGAVRRSFSYLQMTLSLVRQLGLSFRENEKGLQIEPKQRINQSLIGMEPDMSSAFALAALAVASGELVLESFPKSSLQPDSVFVDILMQAGGDLRLKDGKLCVKKSELQALDINLENNPDLFPVLAILLSRAQGNSVLRGLEVLKHKESDRLGNTYRFLKRLGFDCRVEENCFFLTGETNHVYPSLMEFDPDHDHRMAMAAALAQKQGANIKILNPEVVNKSFPEFWQLVGR